MTTKCDFRAKGRATFNFACAVQVVDADPSGYFDRISQHETKNIRRVSDAANLTVT